MMEDSEDIGSLTEIVVSYQNTGFCKEFYEHGMKARWINNSASSIPLRMHIDTWNESEKITLCYDYFENYIYYYICCAIK